MAGCRQRKIADKPGEETPWVREHRAGCWGDAMTKFENRAEDLGDMPPD